MPFRPSIALAAVLVAAAPPPSPPPAPAMEHDPLRVRTSEGLTLAAWVSRPAGRTGPLPALFFTQWVSCGSIAPGAGDPARLHALAAAAGYAVIRVERSGTGASEGPGCDKLDYDTEVRHYREAFDRLVRHPWVDARRVVVYGSSLGATTAPLVAQGKPVAGLLVQGGGALTYFERMVNFDRRQLERPEAFAPTRTDATMRRRIAFQQHYLLGKQTPQAIEARYPELRGVWASLLGTVSEPPHYGRPHAWHWQAADKDWLAAWATVPGRVMVVYGEYDQFEDRSGHRAIVETVERLRPGTTRWLEIPGADHELLIYPSRLAAYSGEGGERRWHLFVEPVAEWLRALAEA
jgi:hypothetical protein